MADLLHALAWNQLVVVPFAGTVWLVTRGRLFRERPALRHGLWLLVLLKFVAPALIPLAFLPAACERNLEFPLAAEDAETTGSPDVALADPAARSAASRQRGRQAANVASGAGLASRSRLLIVLAFVLSLAVSVWLWATAIGRAWRLRRLLGRPGGEPVRAVEALRDVSRTFGLKKEPRLLIVEESVSPMLWAGSGGLAVVLPRAMTASVGDARLRQILAHELAHYVRRDHWGNLLAFVVTSLFWWNPIAWLARRELRTAAESCCDAMAIRRLAGSRKSYAETMLAVVDFVTSGKPFPSSVAATFGESGSLKRRIEMIANPNVKTSLSRSGLLLVVCGAVLLTLAPARAKQEAATTPGAAAAAEEPGPGAETASSLGAEARAEAAKRQRGLVAVLTELANSEQRGLGVQSPVKSVSLRPGPERDPASITFVMELSLIPADNGAPPLDGNAVLAFLSRWIDHVAARGVTMSVERIETAPADRGNGVDLEIAFTLLRVERREGFAAYVGGVPAAKTRAGSRETTPGGRAVGPASGLPGIGAGAEPGAREAAVLTVLRELSVDGVRATVQQVHLRRLAETDPFSTAFVLTVNLTPADQGAEPLDAKAVHAFLKSWMEAVTARGVLMMVDRIRTGPADRGEGVDVEVSGTLR